MTMQPLNTREYALTTQETCLHQEYFLTAQLSLEGQEASAQLVSFNISHLKSTSGWSLVDIHGLFFL